LPEAEMIICPTLKREKYPFRELAGVGVAFKLAQALLRSDKTKNNDAFEKWLLDIVAIGTVADCMPLLNENRTLVKWGLLVLNKTQRLGLKELIEIASWDKEIDARTIGFQIAPRLNAAGRMDHANAAYELLVTADEAEALAIANDLNQKNQNRQTTTEEMMKISLAQIGEPGIDDKILFSSYDNWSPGLVGLAAGKLADKFSRPVIVFARLDLTAKPSQGKTGDKYVASGRSIPEFDITSALNECREYLKEFGGHAQACGLTIIGEDNYNNFREKMLEIAREKLAKIVLAPSLEIEAEIGLNEINWELIDELVKFAPFGENNREPVFLTKNLIVDDINTMGTNNKHLRLVLGGKKFVGFGLADRFFGEIKIGQKVEAVYKLGVNEWNGTREIQCQVVDIKKIED
jgi:single-stranded-DNA-specific exonuclease